jgi:cell division protein FtsQ
VLALPHGDTEPASALVQFARLDGVNRLLGGKVAAFDMRAPDRIYMRIPDRAKAQSLAAQAAKSAENE